MYDDESSVRIQPYVNLDRDVRTDHVAMAVSERNSRTEQPNGLRATIAEPVSGVAQGFFQTLGGLSNCEMRLWHVAAERGHEDGRPLPIFQQVLQVSVASGCQRAVAR